MKTRSEIEQATGLNNKQVLDAGKALVDNQLVSQEKINGQTAYRKDDFYARHKSKILSLAHDKEKLRRHPRSSHVRGASTTVVKVAVSSTIKRPKQIMVDDIDSFERVKIIRDPQPKRVSVSENAIKEGIKRVLGESGDFKDWGGEHNDLVTTRLRIAGKRCHAVFAFKGPAQTGKLTPGKMGKNGDQIQRLFQADADLYVVQYVGEVGEQVTTLMDLLALAKATVSNRSVRYAIIDGQDTSRLIKAYPKEFGNGG